MSNSLFAIDYILWCWGVGWRRRVVMVLGRWVEVEKFFWLLVWKSFWGGVGF